jgi:uncharacterized protein (TIGR03435 family)
MAALILVVVIGLLWRQQDALAVGESVDGSLYRVVDGRPQSLQAGERIAVGDTVRSEHHAGGTIKLADGSSLEMSSEAELSFEGAKAAVQINLSRGGVIVDSAPANAGSPAVVQTKDVRVPVAGTVLVNAETIGSRVAVLKGEARVQQGLTEKTLGPGEQLATNPAMKLQPVSQEIAWSPRAETHLASLQQSTAVSAVELRETFEVISIRKGVEVSGGGRGTSADGSVSARCQGKRQLDPSRFAVTNAGVYFLVAMAYDLADAPVDCGRALRLNTLSGGPEWINSATFNIEATIPDGPPALVTNEDAPPFRLNADKTPIRRVTTTPGPRLRKMIRAMLEDRFKLKLRRELKEVPSYVLSAGANSNEKLKPLLTDGVGLGGSFATVGPYRGITNFKTPKLNYGDAIAGGIGGRLSMDALATNLAWVTGKPVFNRTGIPGAFDFEIFYAPAEFSPDSYFVNQGREGRPLLGSPSLFKVLETDLGLKLDASREKVEVFVIESIERPSEN